MPAVSQEIGMSGALAGFISSLYFYAYAAVQPIGGTLNDRFGPGKIVAAGISISAVGALCFAFGNQPVVFAFGRFLMGLGLGPMLSGSLVFVSNSSMKARYVFFTGFVLTFGNVGSIISVYPLGFAMDRWGRQSVFIGLACINIILAVSLLFSIRRSHIVFGKHPYPPLWAGIRKSVSNVFRNPGLRRMIIPWCFLMGSIMSLQGLWAVSWFQAAYDISFLKAQGYASIISIGVMLGHFFGGYIGAANVYRRFMIIVYSGMYAGIWILFWGGMTLTFPIYITAGLGFLVGVFVGVMFDHIIAGVNDLSAPGEGGSTFGIMNFFPFIGAIVFQWLTGIIISWFSTESGFSALGFQITFLFVMVTVIIAFVLFFRLPRFENE
jgi:MFS family permease